MSTAKPTLVNPQEGATFRSNEIVRFQWEVEPAGSAPVKFDFYIGRSAAKPSEGALVQKRWLFAPGNAETSYNESPDVLGLPVGATYYWQVVREDPGHGFTLFSEVRSLRIQEVSGPSPGGVAMRLHCPERIRLGANVALDLGLTNTSSDLTRLTFTTRAKFDVAIYATRGILSDKLLWTNRPQAQTQDLEVVDLAPNTSLTERAVWDQQDSNGWHVASGRYRVVARSLAQDVNLEMAQEFTIYV